MRSTVRCRGDRGTSATTLALVMPALMLMLMLIVQYGLNYHAQQRAAAAADRAVSVARWSDASAGDGEAAGMAFLEGAPLIDPSVVVVKDADEVTATVQGVAEPLVSIMTWTVSAQATAPVERFIPENERP